MRPNRIFLTEEQKSEVDSLIAAGILDVLIITQKVFKDPSLKLSQKEGRAVKEYLAKKAITQSTEKNFVPELSDEQKKLIEVSWENLDNASLFSMCFPSKKYNINSLEWTAIHKYISDVLYPRVSCANDKKYERKDYKPPKNLQEVCFKVREYLNNDWKVEKLKKEELECAESLKKYLSDVRFVTRMSNYFIEDDRRIFESTFIKYCYDKPDLTQEELDQFITLCIEVTIGEDILKRMEILKKKLDEIAEDRDGKISMGLNEAIKNFQDDYNQCITRQRNLYKTLTGERKSRIDQMIQANASVIHLVRAMKDKEKRDRMALLGENRKERLKEEVNKFMSMDELKGIIGGIDPNIAING